MNWVVGIGVLFVMLGGNLIAYSIGYSNGADMVLKEWRKAIRMMADL